MNEHTQPKYPNYTNQDHWSTGDGLEFIAHVEGVDLYLARFSTSTEFFYVAADQALRFFEAWVDDTRHSGSKHSICDLPPAARDFLNAYYKLTL